MSATQAAIEKLRKLMERMEGEICAINTEEEAQTAAALLQKQLLKHNLTMDDLKKTMTEKQKKENIIEEVLDVYTKKSIGGEWEFNLLWVIAKWNLCNAFWLGKKKNRKAILIGREENVKFCIWLYSMLIDRYVSFSKTKFKEYQLTRDWCIDPINLDTFQRRYLLGCCDGLNEKFRMEANQEKAKDQEYGLAVQGLVKVCQNEIKQYMNSGGWNTHPSTKSPNISSGAAYEQGKIDGRNTNTAKGVTSGIKIQKALG